MQSPVSIKLHSVSKWWCLLHHALYCSLFPLSDQPSILPPIPDFTSLHSRAVAKKTLHRAPSVKSHRKANAATSKAAPQKSHCSINAYTHDNIQHHTKGIRSRCMLAPLT
jgi:hypothetical protein